MTLRWEGEKVFFSGKDVNGPAWGGLKQIQ